MNCVFIVRKFIVNDDNYNVNCLKSIVFKYNVMIYKVFFFFLIGFLIE